MVNNSTNIYKMNNHLSHELTEHKKKEDMTLEIQVWHGTDTKMCCS